MQENESNKTPFTDLGEPVEAAEVQDEFEADILISKLAAHNIPAYLKHSEFGGIAKLYCGRSNFPISVMVPETLLEQAKEILAKAPNGEEYDFSEAETMPPPEDKVDFPVRSALLLLGGICILLLFLYKILA